MSEMKCLKNYLNNETKNLSKISLTPKLFYGTANEGCPNIHQSFALKVLAFPGKVERLQADFPQQNPSE